MMPTKPSKPALQVGRRAAIYVRMSSQPQDHSIEHQCERLYEYAHERGIEIVKMYADAGKSGLRINNREGLYRWYLDDHLSDTEIAGLLNQKKVRTESGRPWTPWLAKGILTNEKYMGQIIFNRGSSKLKSARELNLPEDWICVDDALPPIISPAIFQQAKEERLRRASSIDDQTLLAMLRALHKKHGKVTVELINAESGLPCPKYFSARFGTLANAYAIAGVADAEKLQYARTKHSVLQLREATMSACKLLIERAGATHASCMDRWCLRINDSTVMKLVVARSRHDLAGRIRWRIPVHTPPIPEFVVCVQMDAANAGVLAYYLIPVSDFEQGHIILRAEHPDDRVQYRYPSLASMFGQEMPSAVAS